MKKKGEKGLIRSLAKRNFTLVIRNARLCLAIHEAKPQFTRHKAKFMTPLASIHP